jgi:hypothetical protein
LTFPGSHGSQFEGADPAVATNYFHGKKAVTVPSFHRLRRMAVYPGIDVVYYGDGGHLEYDFEIAPGADPAVIRMRFDGADHVSLNGRGALVLTVGEGEITQLAPVVYQRTGQGEVVAVESAYVLKDDGTVRVRLGKYNPANPLVVDPSILYAGYFSGSTGPDAGIAVTHDTQGNVYLAGYAYSTDFPIIGNSEQNTEAGDRDAWVMIINLPSQTVTYSSYLGGSGEDDLAGIAVSNGYIYLTGFTTSTDFPVTASGYLTTITADTHVYFAMLDPTQIGSAGVLYASYMGGSGTDDEPTGIVVSGGLIYLAGFTNSTDFPTFAPNSGTPYQATLIGTYNAWVAQFDPTQSGANSLLASTYLGGSIDDMARTIALDTAGNVYIAGQTYSPDYPITSNAYNQDYTGDGDAFLSELNLNTQTLIYSTFFGGSSIDDVKKMLIDPSGRIAMTGYTVSPDFPITANAYQTAFGENGNAFLTIIDLTQAGLAGLYYSSYFGGSGGEVAYSLALDPNGRYWFGGYTLSTNLPVSPDALNATSAGGGVDAFIAAINPAGGSKGLVYGSYITGPGTQTVRGVDIVTPQTDSTIQVLIIGSTTSNIFPANAAQIVYPGHITAFFLALGFQAPSVAGATHELTSDRRRIDSGGAREPR